MRVFGQFLAEQALGVGDPFAARAMVAAELRLSITSQELTRSEGWQADRCGRTPGPHGAGHQWQVYAATVAGRLDPPRRRVRRPRWLDVSELERLARRTADYARGEISDSQFYARPGIQPVWVGFLAGLGIIGMAKHDLAAIECVAQAGGRR